MRMSASVLLTTREKKQDQQRASARRGNAQTLGNNAESGQMGAGDKLCAASAIRAWTDYRRFGRPDAVTRVNVFVSARGGKVLG